MNEKTPNGRFKEIRLSFKPKLSQSQFAELLGISLATVQKIEQGEKLSDNVLTALELKLNVNAAYIVYGKGHHFYDDKKPDVSEKLSAPKSSKDPYRDFALQHLEKEVEEWKAEYRWMKQLVTDLRNGIPLGKLRRVKDTALATGTLGW